LVNRLISFVIEIFIMRADLASCGCRLCRKRFHLSGIEISDEWRRIRRLFQHQHQQVLTDKFRLLLPLGSRQI